MLYFFFVCSLAFASLYSITHFHLYTQKEKTRIQEIIGISVAFFSHSSAHPFLFLLNYLENENQRDPHTHTHTKRIGIGNSATFKWI